MTNKVQISETLNERGNRSYTSNYVYPQPNESTPNDLYIVCATIGPGVMYRGEQVAEQVTKEFADYIRQHSSTTAAEPDAQAELLANALLHTEAQMTAYNVLHPECNGITATLACVHFTENGAIVGWVGDTRTVLIRSGMLIKQTSDHSTKYPYDDFSLHPRRSVTRAIEGTDKPASIDVEWWNEVQPNDIIVIGTYSITRPLEQGFLGDAWERTEMRHAIKLACDAHARDNYAITTIRMAADENAAAAEAIAPREVENIVFATPAFLSEDDEPTLESETAPIEDEIDGTHATHILPDFDPSTDPDNVVEVESGLAEIATTDEPEISVTETDNTDEPIEIDDAPEVVAVENEVEVVADAPKPIIGNYTYEEEEDEPTDTLPWIPSTPKNEPVVPIILPTNEPVTPPNPIMENPKQPSSNNETTKPIVDFTPISDKSTTNINNSSSGGSTGWLAAAAIFALCVVGWIGYQVFGGGVDDTLSAQLSSNLNTELEQAETPADKLAVYEKYKNFTDQKYKGKINEETIASIDEGLAETTNLMAQPDNITAADMSTSAAAIPPPAAPEQKETPTEMGEKTAETTQTPHTVAPPVTSSGALSPNKGQKATNPVARVKKPTTEPMARPGAKVVAGVNTIAADPFKAYDKAWVESEGFRVVSRNGKWGWAKADGTSLIAPIYEECGSFHNGMAAVKKGGKWGFANTAGKLVVGYKYQSVTTFGAKCAGLAQVNDGKKLFFIDASGKEAAACK